MSALHSHENHVRARDGFYSRWVLERQGEHYPSKLALGNNLREYLQPNSP